MYFLLIGVASLMVGLEFVVDTHRKDLKEQLISNLEKYSQREIDLEQAFRPIDRLRSKALMMIAIIMFVMIIVLTMFIKNITGPLQHMIEMSKEISNGNLSRTIEINSNNELAELGNSINEMSSNLQEIILLSNNICSSGNNFIERTNHVLEKKNLCNEDLQIIKGELCCFKEKIESYNDLVNYFSFYSVNK